jgi:hypothetical protein
MGAGEGDFEEGGKDDDLIDGPEWEYDGDGDGGGGDYYDYVDASDGGDDDETEGYDPASVNGYQLVVY